MSLTITGTHVSLALLIVHPPQLLCAFFSDMREYHPRGSNKLALDVGQPRLLGLKEVDGIVGKDEEFEVTVVLRLAGARHEEIRVVR